MDFRFSASGVRQRLSCAMLWAAMLWVAIATGGEIARGEETGGMPLPDGAVLRIGTTFLCHTAAIPTLDFSPDGKTLITAGHSRWVNVWDVATGLRTKTIKMATAAITDARLSVDGRRLLTAEPNVIQIWDLATGVPVGQILTDVSPGKRVMFTKDGVSIVSLDVRPDAEKKFLKLYLQSWNLRTLKEEQVELSQITGLPNANTTKATMSPQATWIAWHTPATKEFSFSRARPGSEAVTIAAASGGFFRFSANEKWLAKTQPAEVIKNPAAANPPAPAPAQPVPAPPPFDPDDPDAPRIRVTVAPPKAPATPATIVTPTTIKVWNLDSPKESREWQLGHGRSWLLDMNISDDGKYVATAGSNSYVNDPKGIITIRVWDAATGNLLREFDFRNVIGGNVVATELKFSPQGEVLAVEAGPFVQLWNWREGRAQLPQLTGQIVQRANPLWFRSDGTQLAAIVDQKVLLWNAATGKPLPAPLLPPLGATAFSTAIPKGELLAYVDQQNEGKVVRIVQYGTAEPRGALPDNGKRVTSMRWSDMDRLGVLTEDGNLRIWNSATQQVVSSFNLPVNHIFWGATNEGKTLLTSISNTETVQLPKQENDNPRSVRFTIRNNFHLQGWNAADGTPVELGMPDTGRLAGIKISPDGNYLAGMSAERKSVALWDLNRKELIRVFPFYCERGYAFAFSPDSRRLAQVDESTDRLFLWDTSSGGFVGGFDMQGPGAIAVTFSDDGKRLATSMSNNSILIWDAARAGRDPAITFNRRTAADLESLWKQLSSNVDYYKGVIGIAYSGDQGVDFIAEKLELTANGGAVEKLLVDLDSDQFDVREKATLALIKVGSAIQSKLKSIHAATDSLEVRKRTERILAALPPEAARSLLTAPRAVEALETIGTPEAKRVLKQLAAGVADLDETKAAKAALVRLERIEQFESKSRAGK